MAGRSQNEFKHYCKRVLKIGHLRRQAKFYGYICAAKFRKDTRLHFLVERAPKLLTTGLRSAWEREYSGSILSDSSGK